MKDIHTHNRFHLGDQLYHIHFISKYVKEFPEYRFFNYMLPEYIPEANLHRHPGTEENIINLPLEQHPHDSHDSWINRENYYEIWIQDAGYHGYVDYDVFYINFYKYFFQKLGLQIPTWTAADALFNHPEILTSFPEIKSDFIIVNSITRSGQWGNNPADFDNLIGRLLAEGHTVTTTMKSSYTSVPSTMEDYKLNLLQLGSFVSSCKYVIGKHTAPWAFTLNESSIQNLEFLICMHVRGVSYSPDKVYPVRHSFDEVYKILHREKLIK